MSWKNHWKISAMVQPTSPTKGGKPRNTLDQHVEAIHLLGKPKNTSFYFGVFQKWGETAQNGWFIHSWMENLVEMDGLCINYHSDVFYLSIIILHRYRYISYTILDASTLYIIILQVWQPVFILYHGDLWCSLRYTMRQMTCMCQGPKQGLCEVNWHYGDMQKY